MATTNVTSVITLYTVGDCAFPISDIRATKPISDFGISKVDLTVAEDCLTTIEKNSRHMAKKVFEPVSVGEKTVNHIRTNKGELLNFADAFRKVGLFFLLFKEPVSVVEKEVKKLNKFFFDFLMVSGKLCKQAGMNANEALTIENIFNKTAVFRLAFAEIVAVIPRANRDTGVNYYEQFTLSSTGLRILEAFKKESVNIAGIFAERSVFNREFAEHIYSSTKIIKKYGLSQEEFFELAEAYIRHANAVVSDISIGQGEMTLQDFLDKISSPPGYDKFIDFIVGEYEYQDALVRMVIKAGAAKSEPLIYNMAVNVDVDDTVDRGTAHITDTSKPTTIKFNKHYYHPPEVGVTVKGGAGADIITVEIVEIREDGFDVSLYNSSRVRVAGTITWTAVGY